MDLTKFRGIVNKNKNKNLRFVKVRSSHKCKCCSKVIQTGEESLTINRKRQGREWQCISCLTAIMNYIRAEAALRSVSDDGMYYALCDYLVECDSELEERGIRL